MSVVTLKRNDFSAIYQLTNPVSLELQDWTPGKLRKLFERTLDKVTSGRSLKSIKFTNCKFVSESAEINAFPAITEAFRDFQSLEKVTFEKGKIGKKEHIQEHFRDFLENLEYIQSMRCVQILCGWELKEFVRKALKKIEKNGQIQVETKCIRWKSDNEEQVEESIMDVESTNLNTNVDNLLYNEQYQKRDSRELKYRNAYMEKLEKENVNCKKEVLVERHYLSTKDPKRIDLLTNKCLFEFKAAVNSTDAIGQILDYKDRTLKIPVLEIRSLNDLKLVIVLFDCERRENVCIEKKDLIESIKKNLKIPITVGCIHEQEFNVPELFS